MKWTPWNRFNYALIIVPLVFFFASFFTYFAQDDFFLLHISQATNLSGILGFFIPRPEVVWYRPLSSQVFFFVAHFLFGLQPFYYHLLVVLTHLITIIWLQKLFQHLGLRPEFAFLAALIYGSHQTHTVSLAWLASYSFVLGPLFLVFLIYYSNSFRFTRALLIFFLGVLTTEFFLVFTLLYSWNEFIYTGRVSKRKFILFFALSALALYLRFIAFPTRFSSTLYAVGANSEFLPTLKFYVYRLIGIPLLFDTLPVPLQWASLVSVLVCVGLVVVGIYATYRVRATLPKWLLFASGVTGASLLPFLLLTSHVAPYYLSFTLVTLIPILCWFISHIKFTKTSLTVPIALVAFLLVNTIGIFWTYQTHWIFRRARLAHELVIQNSLIHPVGSEEYISLGAGSAAQFFESSH